MPSFLPYYLPRYVRHVTAASLTFVLMIPLYNRFTSSSSFFFFAFLFQRAGGRAVWIVLEGQPRGRPPPPPPRRGGGEGGGGGSGGVGGV